MRADLIASAITAGFILSMTGCDVGTSGSSELLRPSSTQAESPIPAVNNHPRDVTAMARRPCELLTVQQAIGFGLDLPPEQMDGLLGTLRCEWTNTTRDQRTIRTVDVSMFTNNLTLEAIYDRRQSFPFFEITEVSGYPAITRRANATIPSCDIDIKPAENQSISVSYKSKEFNNNPQQSCEVAKQVAAAVLMNLPLKS